MRVVHSQTTGSPPSRGLRVSRSFSPVIPAQAGIHKPLSPVYLRDWIPAYAGMPRFQFPLVVPPCHSRAGGNPQTTEPSSPTKLDPRLRGDDERVRHRSEARRVGNRSLLST